MTEDISMLPGLFEILLVFIRNRSGSRGWVGVGGNNKGWCDETDDDAGRGFVSKKEVVEETRGGG